MNVADRSLDRRGVVRPADARAAGNVSYPAAGSLLRRIAVVLMPARRLAADTAPSWDFSRGEVTENGDIMATAGKKTNTALDAIELLKADHREVEGWFKEFESTESDAKKQKLATQICDALTVHTEIEEEIFYPAFLAATQDEDLHNEALVEHDGAKTLIAKIRSSSSADELFDAQVTVLSEMIKHHVKEEEQPDGMFAEAKKSDMDLEALGEEMAARKSELMAQTA
jgi:hemerythrin superfamily protein